MSSCCGHHDKRLPATEQACLQPPSMLATLAQLLAAHKVRHLAHKSVTMACVSLIAALPRTSAPKKQTEPQPQHLLGQRRRRRGPAA